MSKLRKLKCVSRIFPQISLIESKDLIPFIKWTSDGTGSLDSHLCGPGAISSSFFNKGQLSLNPSYNWEIILDEDGFPLLICTNPPIEEENSP